MEAGRVKNDNANAAHPHNNVSLRSFKKGENVRLRFAVALKPQESRSPLWKETWLSRAVSSETRVSGREKWKSFFAITLSEKHEELLSAVWANNKSAK